jgi:hypothetical protein
MTRTTIELTPLRKRDQSQVQAITKYIAAAQTLKIQLRLINLKQAIQIHPDPTLQTLFALKKNLPPHPLLALKKNPPPHLLALKKNPPPPHLHVLKKNPPHHLLALKKNPPHLLATMQSLNPFALKKNPPHLLATMRSLNPFALKKNLPNLLAMNLPMCLVRNFNAIQTLHIS